MDAAQDTKLIEYKRDEAAAARHAPPVITGVEEMQFVSIACADRIPPQTGIVGSGGEASGRGNSEDAQMPNPSSKSVASRTRRLA